METCSDEYYCIRQYNFSDGKIVNVNSIDLEETTPFYGELIREEENDTIDVFRTYRQKNNLSIYI